MIIIHSNNDRNKRDKMFWISRETPRNDSEIFGIGEEKEKIMQDLYYTKLVLEELFEWIYRHPGWTIFFIFFCLGNSWTRHSRY